MANTKELAQRFIDHLHRLERGGAAEVDAMAALFADDARLTNPLVEHRGESPHGTEGARQFWSNYRAAFQAIDSRFSAVTTGRDAAGLFWHSSGKNAQGQTVEYDGASLLMFDETGRITNFRGYFDSRSLVATALGPAAASSSAQNGYG